MNPEKNDPLPIGRRDWLKLGGVGGAAALLATNTDKLSAKSTKPGEVRGIVFMVSDGMSNGVLTMAELLSKVVKKRGTHWWKLLNNPIASRGFMETSSANSYVTDSSAASSAWGGGAKINNGAVNIRPDGTESTPILRYLKKKGRRTGLVSTATITHATPAGFAAVTKNRGDEHIIAKQYVDVVDILLGGGMRFFNTDKRADKYDVLSDYKKAGYSLVHNREGLSKFDGDRILGIFSDSHIPYEVDRLNNKDIRRKVPSLATMSEVALKNLLKGDKKFLLQIEGARVDHAAHANDIAGLLWDQLAFDDAIGKVLELVENRDDILVIITSDHGNSNPGLNGTGGSYTGSNDAFHKITRFRASHERLFHNWNHGDNKTPEGLAKDVREHLGFDLKKEEAEALYASLTNGKVVEWSNQLKNPHGILGQIAGNHTGVGWTGTSHTSDATMLSAIGPQAERFDGIVQNHEVYQHFIDLLG